MAEDTTGAGGKAPDVFDVEQFIEMHGDGLVKSAYALCGDEMEAQDLAQETLVQGLKSWRRFRGESSVRTWLQGILLNLCRRRYRKQKRLVYDEEAVLRESVASEHGREMDAETRTVSLRAALRELSPEHREVIALRYYEELKIEEIARRIGAAPGTVKSRLHHAVRHLERLLPAELNESATSDTMSKERR